MASILRAKRALSRDAIQRPASQLSPRQPPSGEFVAAKVRPPRAHVLDVPFTMRGVATAAGARWDANHSVFMWTGDSLPASLAPFKPARWSWEAHVERELRGDDRPPPSRDAGSIVLRPHQVEAVRSIVRAHRAKRPGFLLADDVGLGKTITTWRAILEMGPEVDSILIVCPLAVVAHWRRTIEAMGDGGKDIVILNYDRLGKLFEVTPEARKKIRSKKGLARAGSAKSMDVVVFDESHRCKNPTAARSKLAAKLTANAGFCLWLSATAGQNPLELSYLAPLLASVTNSRVTDLKDFEAWCQREGLGITRGNFGKWEWRGDPSDSAKVHAMLFAPSGSAREPNPAGIRRRPEDIAGWPEINRILTPIELAPDARELYVQAWTAFRREMELAPRGRDPKSALAATLRLRQKSSLIRVAGTTELVTDLLANGHQVAISVAFMESLAAMRDGLNASGASVAEIHGAMPALRREEERLRFQRGDAEVVLFTVEEGISLHQGEHNDVPRSSVIHDLRWSAIQMAQIEGRCHRDGRFAQIYWAYADDTIEDRIARVVARRIQSMKEMIGDDTTTLREIERLLDGDA